MSRTGLLACRPRLSGAGLDSEIVYSPQRRKDAEENAENTSGIRLRHSRWGGPPGPRGAPWPRKHSPVFPLSSLRFLCVPASLREFNPLLFHPTLKVVPISPPRGIS